MRTLARNKRVFAYCLCLGEEALYDEYGNETSEYKVLYSDPYYVKGNISPATGQSRSEQFGDLMAYDKVIVLSDTCIPITESTVLFIDKPYEKDSEGMPLYDYIVRRVAKSLNSVSIAIGKVEVGGHYEA